MRHCKPLLGMVGVCLLSASWSGAAVLRFHLDPRAGQAQTADGKPVLVDRAGGLSAVLTSTAWADGLAGKALSFNGKPVKDGGSCVVVPDSPKVPFLVDFEGGPFTLAVWFRPDADQDYRQQQELVNTAGDTGPGYRLTYSWRVIHFISGTGGRTPDGKADYWSVDTDPTVQRVVDGAWNHVAVVRDEKGFVTLYLNGQPTRRSQKPFAVTQGKSPLTIGAYMQGYAYPLKGAIGDVRIWQGACTAAEIRAAAHGLGNGVAPNVGSRSGRRPSASATSACSRAPHRRPCRRRYWWPMTRPACTSASPPRSP